MASSFIPATEWSLLPFDVKQQVISFLPIRDRVVCERVQSDAKTISEELFKKQKVIGRDWYSYDYSDGAYINCIKRCPNLEVITAHKLEYAGYDEKMDIVSKLYKYCPKIRSFRGIYRGDFTCVMSYLLKYIESDEYVEGSIKALSCNGLNVDGMMNLFEVINFHIKNVIFPYKLTQNEYLDYKFAITCLETNEITSIELEFPDDVETEISFQYAVPDIIHQDDLYAINLTHIRGPLNQEIFDMVCNNCPNIETLVIDHMEMERDDIDLSNLMKLTKIELFRYFFFETVNEHSQMNRQVLINYLIQYGCNIETLAFAIASPVDTLLGVISEHCKSIKKLFISLQSLDDDTIHIISQMKTLRELVIFHPIISEDDANKITNSIKRLGRFEYNVDAARQVMVEFEGNDDDANINAADDAASGSDEETESEDVKTKIGCWSVVKSVTRAIEKTFVSIFT